MKFRSFLMLLGFLCLAAVGANAQADAISKYFEQYLDDERFTVVYISPKMFQMIDKLNFELDDYETKEIAEVVSDLRGLRILTAEEGGRKFYEEAMRKINTTEYEVLMTVRNKAEDDVQFLIKDEGNVVNELLMVVGGDDNFILMSFVGNIDLEKVAKLSQSIKESGDDDDYDND